MLTSPATPRFTYGAWSRWPPPHSMTTEGMPRLSAFAAEVPSYIVPATPGLAR